MQVSCYNAMTLAATTSGVVALAAHQATISVFFLGCKFGDAVSQTSQAYLPACYDAASLSQPSDGDAARLRRIASSRDGLDAVSVSSLEG